MGTQQINIYQIFIKHLLFARQYPGPRHTAGIQPDWVTADMELALGAVQISHYLPGCPPLYWAAPAETWFPVTFTQWSRFLLQPPSCKTGLQLTTGLSVTPPSFCILSFYSHPHSFLPAAPPTRAIASLSPPSPNPCPSSHQFIYI
jgi:hypothetical protein